MKVLFCVDGSESSFFAIEHTLKFLNKDSEICLINVLDLGLFPNFITFPHDEEEGLESFKSESQMALEDACKLVEEKGFNVFNSILAKGNPYEVIMKEIDKGYYNLVVLGSHGTKGLKKWLGSVSRKIVNKSPIPVIIAKIPQNREQLDSKNILFAVDGSKYSYNAIDVFVHNFNLYNSTIEILSVKPGLESLPVEIAMDEEWLKECLKKQDELTKEILYNANKLFNDNLIKVDDILTKEGEAAEEIINYLNSTPKDLVVMGSHGREGFADWLLGSTSKRVLHYSSVSILICPLKKIVCN